MSAVINEASKANAEIPAVSVFMLTCKSLIGRIARITAPSVNGITATLNEISVFVVTDSKIGSLLLPKSC